MRDKSLVSLNNQFSDVLAQFCEQISVVFFLGGWGREAHCFKGKYLKGENNIPLKYKRNEPHVNVNSCDGSLLNGDFKTDGTQESSRDSRRWRFSHWGR